MVENLPKKSLGQHWLEDKPSLEAIVDAANVQTGDTVLEIGPGKGSLTASLLEQGAKVLAVEVDESLSSNLKKKFQNKDFKLNTLSILNFDFNKLPSGYKIVANIPYYLTNHLFRLLGEIPNKPAVAAFLVQKEVAERLAARPGQMSVLAIATQLNYEVSLGRIVPAKLFSPPPKVDSQIVVLKIREKPLYEARDNYFRIVKAGFSEKRKKLRSSLAGGLGISKSEAEELLKSEGIDPNSRAQELALDDWHRLCVAYQQ